MHKKFLLAVSLLGSGVWQESASHPLAGPAASVVGTCCGWILPFNVFELMTKKSLLSGEVNGRIAQGWSICGAVPSLLSSAFLWCAAYGGTKVPYVISPWGSGVIGFFVGFAQLLVFAVTDTTFKPPFRLERLGVTIVPQAVSGALYVAYIVMRRGQQ